MFKCTVLFTIALGVVNAARLDIPRIVRPCNLKDYKCIADNLAANSQCNPNVRGAIPPQYTLNDMRFETPYFNASYVDNTLIIRNHQNCFVSEYSVNTVSGNEVLAIDCPWLDFESRRTLYQHKSLMEDESYQYNIRGSYPLIRLTTTLRRDWNFCGSFTFADVTAMPIMMVSPDQRSKNFLSKDLSFLPIYERETFFYRAKQLFRYFINSYICDFSCNA